jgi:trypsin
MSQIRKCLALSALIAALSACSASPAIAVVGGHDASPGEYPAIAEVTFGPFLCSGTLIAPDWVLSAGHCGSITGALVASPVAWPAVLMTVRIGGLHPGQGEKVPVKRVLLSPKYLLTDGYDVTLMQLRRNSTKAPVKVAGASERGIWRAGTSATIAGWGITSEHGSLPSTLQEANVPITSDSTCAAAYSTFDPATMVCAGFPQGGVDACEGDSGGPLFAHAGTVLRVVSVTSFGEGCARPGKPGVYARAADTALREWIRSQAPAGVN